MSRTKLKNLLRKKIVTITFTKVDGSKRVMKATLKDDLIDYEPKDSKDTEKVRKENKDILSVQDIDANGWRSFRLDSLIRVDK